MLGNNITKRPVRQAVKMTRSALNHALDVAEPRLEKAAGDLETLSRDALKALRETSMNRLDDISSSRFVKRLRKRLPAQPRRRVGKVALVAAGLAIIAFAIFRSA